LFADGAHFAPAGDRVDPGQIDLIEQPCRPGAFAGEFSFFQPGMRVEFDRSQFGEVRILALKNPCWRPLQQPLLAPGREETETWAHRDRDRKSVRCRADEVSSCPDKNNGQSNFCRMQV
jgi:hypothetical protein